jgi:hypothetical protein
MQDIKEYLSYNPDTGVFTRLTSSNRWKAGHTTGTLDKAGYTIIRYKGKQYKAHRLAWYYVYGSMPIHNIDHINEDKSDNRINNLRLDNRNNNTQNVSLPTKTSKSGLRGVHWCNRDKKWIAQLSVNGRQICVARSDNKQEAYDAYLAAKREHHTFWVENK